MIYFILNGPRINTIFCILFLDDSFLIYTFFLFWPITEYMYFILFHLSSIFHCQLSTINCPQKQQVTESHKSNNNKKSQSNKKKAPQFIHNCGWWHTHTFAAGQTSCFYLEQDGI